MRPVKVVTRDMKDKYSIDKMEVTLTINNITLSEVFGVEISGQKYFDDNRALGRIKRTRHGYVATRTLQFNGNNIMRKIGIDLCGSNRLLTKCDFRHGKNFVPSGVRRELSKMGVPFTALRQKALEQIFQQIEVAKQELVESLREMFKVPFSVERVGTALLYVEISYDKVSNQGYHMATDPVVVDAVNSVLDSAKEGYFNEDGEFRVDGGSASSEISIRNKPGIRAYIKSSTTGKLEFCLYQKEDSGNGSLNRCEGRFKEHNLNKIFTKRSFRSYKRLVEMLDELAEETFNVIYLAFNEVHVPQGKSYDDLKPLLKSMSPLRVYWEEILHQLKTFKRVGVSAMPVSTQRWFSTFAKHEVIFKKVTQGIYKVDWETVPRASENYYRMKILLKEEVAKKKQIKCGKKETRKKKSWLTVGLH